MSGGTFLQNRKGYLIIEVTGKYPERFINLCLYHRVPLWHIKYLPHGFRAETTCDGYRRMRSIARKSKCLPRILEKRGWPFRIAALKKHRLLVSCLLLFLIITRLMSMCVWVVQLEGVPLEMQSAILQTMEDAGLKPGTLKKNININEIIHTLKMEYQDIVWVAIELEGIYASVQIIEEPPVLPKEAVSGDIVAAKNGQIVKLIVLNGTPHVSVGDIVGKNDMIVEGRVYVDNQWLKDVEARALIEAKTWYYGTGQAGLEEFVLKETANKVQERILCWHGEPLNRSKIDVPFELYKIKESQFPLKWRNIVFPLELIEREYIELETEQLWLSRDTALEKAETLAMSEILAQLAGTYEITGVKQEVVEENGVIFVQMVAEVIEDIGSFKVHGSGRTR